MKDEKLSQNNNDVVALKSKSYLMITTDNEDVAKHKGHDITLQVMSTNMQLLTKKYFLIRHRLYTKECMKKSLYNFSEKRYLQSDGINTYALGHKNTLKKWSTKNNYYKYVIYNRWREYLQQK